MASVTPFAVMMISPHLSFMIELSNCAEASKMIAVSPTVYSYPYSVTTGVRVDVIHGF